MITPSIAKACALLLETSLSLTVVALFFTRAIPVMQDPK
jgi:hypothetical protein